MNCSYSTKLQTRGPQSTITSLVSKRTPNHSANESSRRSSGGGLQEDRTRALDLYKSAADHGFNVAHVNLGNIYYYEGNLKMAKQHYAAAAMAGHELAHFYLGNIEMKYENWEYALKHWRIAASDGEYRSMHKLSTLYHLNRNLDGQLVDLFKVDMSKLFIATLEKYNDARREMRSNARDEIFRSYILSQP